MLVALGLPLLVLILYALWLGAMVGIIALVIAAARQSARRRRARG